MKIVLSLLFLSMTLFGNIFEDFNIYNAQKEYEKQNYEKAFGHLSNIKKKDSKVYYNLGNTLYKMGKYEEAILEYSKVTNKDMQHIVNHNIANCHLKLENYEKAVEFYNKALVFKNDERTVYNLEMTKQKQKSLNDREIRDLNENVCEIQRKGIFEELKIDSIFDFYEIDENIKLFEDEQTGISTKNENSKITNNESNEIYLDDKEKTKEELGKKEFKMNSYFDKKYDNNLDLKDSKTLIVPMEKGIINDNKKAW